MNVTKAELLLRLAEDTFDDGSATIDQMQQLGVAHVQRVLADAELIAQAKAINERDQQRFRQYLPQQHNRPGVGVEQSAGARPAALPLRKTAE
jgi:hypothetical protein